MARDLTEIRERAAELLFGVEFDIDNTALERVDEEHDDVTDALLAAGFLWGDWIPHGCLIIEKEMFRWTERVTSEI